MNIYFPLNCKFVTNQITETVKCNTLVHIRKKGEGGNRGLEGEWEGNGGEKEVLELDLRDLKDLIDHLYGFKALHLCMYTS